MPINLMSPFYSVFILGEISNLPNAEFPDRLKAIREGLTEITDRVVGISYNNSDDKMDLAKIAIDNRDLTMIDSGLLFNGNIIILTFGYPGKYISRSLVIDGITGFDMLDVICIGKTLINNKAKTKQFKRLFPEQVANAILKKIFPIMIFGSNKKDRTEAALDIEESRSHEVKMFFFRKGLKGFKIDKSGFKGLLARDFNQAGQTDIEFLYRLAEKVGYNLYTKNGFLVFAPRRFDSDVIATYTYSYGRGDVLSFSVEKFSIIDEPAVVDVRSRDPIERVNNSSIGSNKTTNRKTINSRSVIALEGDIDTGRVQLFAASTIVTSPDPSKANNKKEADMNFVRAKEKEVKATLTVIGNTDISAASMIRLVGFSALLSGRWYVQSASHDISDSGYKSTLKLIRGGTISTKIPKDDESKTTSSKDNEIDITITGDLDSGNLIRRAVPVNPGQGGK